MKKRKMTTYGTILINGKSYEVFKKPISKEIAKKVMKYKTTGDGVWSSKSSGIDKYLWSIEDNKLYMLEVNILTYNQQKYTDCLKNIDKVNSNYDKEIEKCYKLALRRVNIIEKICGDTKVFANWQNKDVEILISQENFDTEIIMKTQILKFSNGNLQSIKDSSKEFRFKKQ